MLYHAVKKLSSAIPILGFPEHYATYTRLLPNAAGLGALGEFEVVPPDRRPD